MRAAPSREWRRSSAVTRQFGAQRVGARVVGGHIDDDLAAVEIGAVIGLLGAGVLREN